MKICIPIQSKTQAEALKKMKQASQYAELAEIWLDEIKDLDLPKLLAKKPLPVVCVSQKAELLLPAIHHGADYVDIPFFLSEKLSKKITCSTEPNGEGGFKKAQKKTKIIISHHDFKKTPSYPELLKLADSMKKKGGDVIKIACQAKNLQDTIHMISLAKSLEGKMSHIIIAMGEKGSLSRILTPTLGGEMMFACLSKKGQTSPGQLTVRQLRNAWHLLKI